jgi:UDP-hydrolysing UDP-N-acetyl-D-glucosamine 2-epimerase
MKNILFFSSNRADLAFIYNLFKLFDKNKKYKLSIILNDHSKVDYNYISKDKIRKIKLPKVKTTKYNLINYLGKILRKYNNILAKKKPDFVFIVGDRYEAFAMTIVCNFLNIKIVHIAGGDITKGAYDEEMRTFISKSAHLHFVTNIQSKKNLENFLNDKKKVFNYGSPSLDYIRKVKLISRIEISNKLNINFNKYNILVTFHPETKNLKSTFENLKMLLKALNTLGTNYNFFITGSNVDTFGQIFNKSIKDFVRKKKNFYYFLNLGTTNYIQLANNCDMVLGNSSSQIYEVPFLGIKSLLLGSRQEGRFMTKNIIKSRMNKSEILYCVKNNIKKIKPKKDLKTYGNGYTSVKIFKKFESIINEK